MCKSYILPALIIPVWRCITCFKCIRVSAGNLCVLDQNITKMQDMSLLCWYSSISTWWRLHLPKQAINVILLRISKNFTSWYVDVINNNFCGLLNYTGWNYCSLSKCHYLLFIFIVTRSAFWGMIHSLKAQSLWSKQFLYDNIEFGIDCKEMC